MNISELGEFGLIEKLAKTVAISSNDVIKSIGDDTGVGALRLVHARHPHLVRADIRDNDIFRIQYLSQVLDDFLGLERKTFIVGVTHEFFHDGLP